MGVGEIQRNPNISRAAVSHHLKILKDAGILSVRQEAVERMRGCPSHKEEKE